ncbi:uncharacterized protein ACA1_141800 [Acanthamoeba castellanii str. Neff]|uniref:Uncharacterized protein n=1 Tax=Acanthamoeba castellanii (strain ATCC 30010 / Neff) TaxID=1257118 RepID=L8HDL7_ACACF|nr:uncharacterized protein ACA1_141800 [Acanthamoeba castellanii str. Neff]ELR22491.1 hypothetical protein ACA1_141800 [Acanthamoeba castellanii str. Neff]
MEALWAAEVAQAVDGVANEQAVLPDARVQALEMLRQVVVNIIDPPKPAGQPSWPDQGAVDAARLRYARLKLVSGLYKRTLALLPSAEAFLRVVGFRRTVEEFQEFLVFTPSPDNLAKLEEGQRKLEVALNRVRLRAEERKMVQIDARTEEQLRREQALNRIRDNRLERGAVDGSRRA